MSSPEKRIRILKVLLTKLFGAPRDPFSLRFLRELVAAGWIEADGSGSSGGETTSFNTVVSEVMRQMKVWWGGLNLLGLCEAMMCLKIVTLCSLQAQTRLSEKLLKDRASTVEALLFARLAPVLVLRVLPRGCFSELGQRRLHVSFVSLFTLSHSLSGL